MNHITALAIARGIQQDHLDAAEQRRRAPIRAPQPPRPSHFGEMARVLLLGFRQRPQPSR
jgi:hypothetical protein